MHSTSGSGWSNEHYPSSPREIGEVSPRAVVEQQPVLKLNRGSEAEMSDRERRELDMCKAATIQPQSKKTKSAVAHQATAVHSLSLLCLVVVPFFLCSLG